MCTAYRGWSSWSSSSARSPRSISGEAFENRTTDDARGPESAENCTTDSARAAVYPGRLGESDVWRRLLLVYRGRVSALEGGAVGRFRLYRWHRSRYPTYRQVCSGMTGHAEAIQITYDPRVISYEELLEVFWKTHDPTTLNQPGQRLRHSVPFGDLLSRRRAEGTGGTLQAKARRSRRFPGTDRHRGRAVHGILSGRGVSSELLQSKRVQPFAAPSSA